jgi:sporulation protein YlmC with PRC-barrel domain
MPTVLASALPEKPVLSADGEHLGTVHNLTIDPQSGEFEHLLVDPARPESTPEGVIRTDDGTLRLPADGITAVGDQVVVTLPDRKP